MQIANPELFLYSLTISDQSSFLTQGGVYPWYSHQCFRSTPLILACTKGHAEVVTSLLELGADIQLKDSYGRTALECAKTNGHTNIVDLLKNHGKPTGKPAYLPA